MLAIKHSIPEGVQREIIFYAKKHSIQKIVLFGSRARGTNRQRSDIDLAVFGGDFDAFYWDMTERVNTLLSFDLIDMNQEVSESLQEAIAKDGVIVYEEVR